MQEKNLDIYGHAAIPWSRALEALSNFEAGPGVSTFLATATADGKPHLAGVGAVWVDDRFYFTSGDSTRKSRNIAENPGCAIAVTLSDMDLVIEGTARRITDDATLQRIVKVFNDQGWPATVKDGAFTAEYSAPSAGPPPWNLYVLNPEVAYGVAFEEPHGAMRWRFQP